VSARHIVHHRAPLGTAAHLHGQLHVVTAVINTRRYGARYRLYHDFVAHMAAQHAQVWTVECAFGDRAFAVTDATNPRHIQVRTRSEIWMKEALWNLGTARLPADAHYVLYSDADVMYQRPDLVNEIVQMLQHHPVVQPWSECIDLGPDYQIVGRHESFAWSHHCGRRKRAFGEGGYYYAGPLRGGAVNAWHPGFAVAMRREAFDVLGGFPAWAILGSGDNHLMWSLLGEAHRSVHPLTNRGYRAALRELEERAGELRRDLGCVRGTITHGWHGKKRDRRYGDRWKILVDHQYDPERHLKRDWQGLPQLRDRDDEASIGLRDDIRRYMVSRHEDSTDL
jgi:hypothetical protein